MKGLSLPSQDLNKKRLKLKTRQLEEAQAEFERRQAELNNLKITAGLASDKEYRAIETELDALSERLHRHRLHMGRKRYSIKIMQKKIAIQEAALVKMDEEEKKLAKRKADLEEKQRRIKDKVAAQIEP